MIAVMGAMEEEVQGLLEKMDDREEVVLPGASAWTGQLFGRSAVIARSGIGKVYGALCAQNLITRFQPRALIFTGLAGGLGAEVSIGDTLIARDLIHHDMDASGLGFLRGEIPYMGQRFFASDPALLQAAAGFKPLSGSLRVGRICTGDQFITHASMASHAYLAEELEGLGVEMEGAAVAQTALLNGVPFLVMRTISDKADGSATVDFGNFLPAASRNSVEFVRFLFANFPW